MRSTTLFILSTSLMSTSAFSLVSTRGSYNTVDMKLNMNSPAIPAAAPALRRKYDVTEHSPLELEIDDERFLQKKKEVYDPLGLYPQYSPERLFDSIQPLESSSFEQQDKPIIDPLNIYKDKSELTSDVVMSASLPFLKRPSNLTGRLPGDRGFEIFNGRLAMLAITGFAIQEFTTQDAVIHQTPFFFNSVFFHTVSHVVPHHF
mmetsp:Transcript_47194/g.54456  ORF Transcript_47194/g.54456 Transcript_47194/m.54456 type:complete len:204 (-) Transcript_47194:88-699(-)